MKKFFGLFAMISIVIFCASAYAEDNLKSRLEEIIAMPKEAAQFLSEKGEDGLPEFNQKEGKWVRGDLYVFVYGLSDQNRGVIIAHPREGLVGKNFLRVRDKKGKVFAAEFLRIAESKAGEGWSEYWWPRLEGQAPEPKISYIVKVPDRDMLAGVGIYTGKPLEDALKVLKAK